MGRSFSQRVESILGEGRERIELFIPKEAK
jgi:hypothetical protein